MTRKFIRPTKIPDGERVYFNSNNRREFFIIDDHDFKLFDEKGMKLLINTTPNDLRECIGYFELDYIPRSLRQINSDSLPKYENHYLIT